MITPPLVQLLIDAGFTDGWAISDGVLVLWEHEEEPPAPLVRPSEASAAAANPAE
jgi:hypothetical protein